jgi:hypothetical protein
LYLNLDPALNPTLLSFGTPTRTGSFGTNPVVSTGVNGSDADGGGSYDINFQFDIAPPGDRFNSLDTITYHVTGIMGWTKTISISSLLLTVAMGYSKPQHISKESDLTLMAAALLRPMVFPAFPTVDRP